jgi:glucose/mannose-6-phosphate isomerase
MDLAEAISGRLPILYADRALYPVLMHFRQQINLVARQLAHVNVYPAMNHDELAGWVHPPALVDKAVMVQVRTSYDHPRVKVRMDICRPVFAPKADKAVEILVRFGDSMLEQCVYLLHLFDWAAFYLARLNGVDPARVEVLDYLEGELAKV